MEEYGVGRGCLLCRPDVEPKEQSKENDRDEHVRDAREAAAGDDRSKQETCEEAAKEGDGGRAGVYLLDEEATGAPEDRAGEEVEASGGVGG